jgi:hypothetical protein
MRWLLNAARFNESEHEPSIMRLAVDHGALISHLVYCLSRPERLLNKAAALALAAVCSRPMLPRTWYRYCVLHLRLLH